MLGVRFLDADFIGVKRSFRRRVARLHTFFAQSQRGAAACTVIAMQDGGTGAGAEANLIFVLPPNVYVAPRVGGDFLVSNLHPGHIPENLAENDFWC